MHATSWINEHPCRLASALETPTPLLALITPAVSDTRPQESYRRKDACRIFIKYLATTENSPTRKREHLIKADLVRYEVKSQNLKDKTWTWPHALLRVHTCKRHRDEKKTAAKENTEFPERENLSHYKHVYLAYLVSEKKKCQRKQ